MEPVEVSENKVRTRPPLLFSIAKDMERKKVRGSTKLLRILKCAGYLDRPVDYRLGNGIELRVPIARNEYDATDLAEYESDLVASLTREARGLPEKITLIDVGADIGLFSLKVLANCGGISRVLAFEPNRDGYPWLRTNLSRLPKQIRAQAIPLAVADFEGQGRLAAPEERFAIHDVNHTQYYLESGGGGPIPVTTLDALDLPARSSLIIKIDVEGGELSVLRGARKTIAEAAACLIVFEAHPLVAQRTGIDPVECLRFLATIRPFQAVAAENGQSIGVDRPLFDQLPPTRVYNLIARSR